MRLGSLAGTMPQFPSTALVWWGGVGVSVHSLQQRKTWVWLWGGGDALWPESWRLNLGCQAVLASHHKEERRKRPLVKSAGLARGVHVWAGSREKKRERVCQVTLAKPGGAGRLSIFVWGRVGRRARGQLVAWPPVGRALPRGRRAQRECCRAKAHFL